MYFNKKEKKLRYIFSKFASYYIFFQALDLMNTTTNRNEVSLSACVPFANSNIVDVNGRTLDELQQRHMINNLRERLGQENQR